MAVSKKYAGLPDLDPAPEIYETPELTEDKSTIQSGTLRSDSPSPSPSEEGRHDPEVGLDRQGIDRDEARRRFHRVVVDARDVDFSDRVGTDRKSYTISSRRRRHQDKKEGEDSDSEDESLPRRLARLRKEAEELKSELERSDEQETTEGGEDGLEDEFSKLNLVLDGLKAPARTQNGTMRTKTKPRYPLTDPTQRETEMMREIPILDTDPSTIAAISSFSDRLSALESALGVSSTLPTAEFNSILPTLNALHSQITTLTSTLTPFRTAHQTPSSPLPTLDDISFRVRTLVSETDKLTSARKAALQSLQNLQEARLRNPDTTPYTTATTISHHPPSAQSKDLANLTTAQKQKESTIFLDEQSTKIDALYQILPTIERLHPILPTVLDRLRSLNLIHTGAADASAELEELERRQGKMEEEIMKWREGLEMVEKGMVEHEGVAKGNVEVVRQMVERLEQRLLKIER